MCNKTITLKMDRARDIWEKNEPIKDIEYVLPSTSRLPISCALYHTNKQTPLYVKTYPLKYLTDFENEVRNLQHITELVPDVFVPFEGACKYPDVARVATQYCSGGDLLDYIIQNTLTKVEKRRVLIGICRILRKLEEKGIAHNDISMDNFFFKCPNNLESLCLGDAESLCFSKLTKTQLTKATTISPEQLYKQEEVDASAIMRWQLGCLIFFMYTEQMYCLGLYVNKKIPIEHKDLDKEMTFLVRNLLCSVPEQRWSIESVLSYINNLHIIR
jgi:serine/threonine protein kinase